MGAGQESDSAVLVVVHHDESGAVFAAALERLGLSVLRARPRDAEDYIKHFGLGAVVTDVAIPDGGGLAVLNAVKKYQPAVPVVAVSAEFIDPAAWDVGHGFAAVLYKPVAPDVLVRAVLRVVDEAGAPA
jgi:CheY-like chemotaxis protein